jgi:signal transduction histidine kinase/HAMP domain-containing protein
VVRALVLSVELALLALVGNDLAHGCTLLSSSQRGLVAAAALLLIWPDIRFARRRAAGIPGGPAAVLGIAIATAVALAGVEELASRRMLRGWEAGAPDRLQARAELLRGDFGWLLSEVTRPFEARIVDSDDARTAFHILRAAHDRTLLPPERYGLALYRPDGQPLAWAGNSVSPPPELFETTGPGPTFLIAGSEKTPRLFATAIDGLTGLRRVAELAIATPAPAQDSANGADLQLEFLPHWNAIEPARAHVVSEQAGDDLAALFALQGDRHLWRTGRSKVLTMTVPLRVPAGQEILTADLSDRRGLQELAARRDVVVRIAAALLAIALVASAALQLRVSRWPAWGELLAASSAIWGVRLLLLLTGPGDAAAPSSLFDISIYASSDLGGLLASPADLLLSCGALLAQAWLLRRFLEKLPLPSSPMLHRGARVLAAVAAALAAIVMGLGLHTILDHQVLEARIDVSRVDLDRDVLPRLALQAALFLAVAAGATLVTALVRLARRTTSTPAPATDLETGGGPPAVIRGVATVLLLTALYVPLVLHAYGMVRRDFFENDLLWRVVHQKEQRRDVLRDALRETADEEWLQTAGYEEDPSSPGGLAYRIWSRTPLASMGLASSLRLYDDNGRLVSRFAVNLGIMLEPYFWQVKEAADSDLVSLPPRSGVTVSKAVVFGSRWVRPTGQPPRLVTFTVVDDYDNVPLLGAESSYLPLLRSRALSRTNPELLAFEPLMAVFSPGLERLYESGGEIPAPSPAVAAAIDRRGLAWTRDEIGEGPARILYFRGPNEIFALAHPSADLMRLLAVFLRLALLNCALYFVAVLAARAGAAIAGHPLPPLVPGRSFYARLTTVFVIGAMAPLLMLSMFVSRFSARESRRELVAAGLSSLQTVRRVAEDYLSLPDPGYGRDLDEEVVFWLSRVVRQDINFYRGAELMASSTPELYLSSLLNTRLDGGVYRALYLDREPFQLARSQVGELDYLTLSAPMRIDRERNIGVVSIPLAAQSRALAVKSEELADAIMIASCLTVALLAVFGWLVARRVSGPIISLAGASRRVAAGDLAVRVGSAPPDEVGVLVTAFNSMAESLQQQRHDLDRRREYIETILTRATTGVVSIDARGIIITINPAAQQLLGSGIDVPRPEDDLADWLKRAADFAPLRRAFERSMDDDLEGEVSLDIGRGEDARRLRAVFLPFTPEVGRPPGRIVLLEDVTDIVRSGRLAAWAEMTRRIAHEIKNPLTPIQLSVEHVRRVWQAGDARFGSVLKECLDNIQGQVRALRQIASEFSAYARVPEIRTTSTTIDQLFDAALDPYVTAPPPGIAISRTVPPGLPEIAVDRAVMARALVNLIENAIQAMASGGTLTLAAAPEDGKGPARVRLTVSDSGSGIAPEILARIFEPYFSTKSGGTGLGLAIARRAVEEHGGTIDIRSGLGRGTVVTLVLPAAPTS